MHDAIALSVPGAIGTLLADTGYALGGLMAVNVLNEFVSRPGLVAAGYFSCARRFKLFSILWVFHP